MTALAYAHLNANGTTVVKEAPGILSFVSINTAGAAANTLTINDGPDTVAVIDTTAGVGTIVYELRIKNRLIATLATGTAADVTIGYE